MPLPIGHAAIGLATHELQSGTSAFRRWRHFLFIVLLANLPDIDVLIGLLVKWNGNAFHRGPTHSLAFALAAGLLAFWTGRCWLRDTAPGYRQTVLLIFSHVVADALFTDSAVSFFWPFEVHWSAGHSGWTDVFNTVFFNGFQDGWIVLGAAAAILLIRAARWYRALPRSLPETSEK